MRMFILAAALFGCASTRGVVHPDVTGARLRPYENLWNWAIVGADGSVKPQGTWSDRLEIGGGVGRRTQEQRLPDGRKIVTVNVFDLRTLAPIERDWRVFDGRFTHLEFDGREVRRTAVRKPGAAIETGRAVLPEAVFDFNGGMYGLLLRGFPLRDGYSATFATIAEDGDDVQHLRLIVRGREPVGGRNAWLVEVPESDYGRMTFWLSDDPPYILRLTFPLGQGTVVYEMA